MTVSVITIEEDLTETTHTDIISFSFRKNAYIPYTQLSVQFVTTTGTIPNAAEIKLVIDNNVVHHGLIDTVETRTNCSKNIHTITSTGFTSLLCRNQIEPGLKPNISLNSLMDGFYTIPYVTHENNSDTSNYIYVKNNSSMWDSIANLSYKLLGTYPYIRETNKVMITPFTAPVTYTFSTTERIVLGQGVNYRRLISNYHMADINGEYGTFDLEDADVLQKKIVRHEYFDLDRRFLHDPQQALVYRDKFDSRESKFAYIEYYGYRGEDLFDKVKISPLSTPMRITDIMIKGSDSRIITRLSYYIDKFPK